MSLEKKIMPAMKDAMKAKDQTRLAALRAVKSELLLAKTSGSDAELSDDEEIKLLQKLVKQRKDSARIFQEQGREDLAEPELAQAEVLSEFLPEQMGEDEIRTIVQQVITETGASSMKDMGKVMGRANQLMAGKAEGRIISTIVKEELNK
ncbi:glutamyl-tRNA amidotransferase [Nonlabens spongiae]|uniref:Glutamyl-tRNA amidotransferase n=1 Tax=Nonlabens spongiae TaxID=331648 RepID=A0A1W6MML5_9FLAO|nr:GatB/YqeY domain-containing protein [Nonlabens spongiae]ARN78756.1 glutamyl-tRNA amidotransferase [Nonlabens spongiae]